MNEKMKELRIWMCAAFYIFAALPWVSMKSSADAGGVSDSMSTSISGYTALFASIFGIILLLIPAVLVAMEFLPQMNLPKRLFYLGGSVIGIILTILAGIFGGGAANKGAEIAGDIVGSAGVNTESSTSFGIGLWFEIILFLVILVFTIIKDFAINKEVLKEQGIKGAFNSVAKSVTNDASESMNQLNQSGGIANLVTVSCPQCGASVVKGKKFCNKCGFKLAEVSGNDKPVSEMSKEKAEYDSNNIKREEKNLSKPNKDDMITVREYIASLGKVKCSSCGESVDADKKFCPNCGNNIVVKMHPDKCDQCGGKIIQGKKFCPDCGFRIEEKELLTMCPKCSAELIFGKNFCIECGEKIGG